MLIKIPRTKNPHKNPPFGPNKIVIPAWAPLKIGRPIPPRTRYVKIDKKTILNGNRRAIKMTTMICSVKGTGKKESWMGGIK